MDMEHMVIADEHNSVQNKCAAPNDLADPLNWYLTPAQQCEVEQSANQESNQQLYQAALKWFLDNTGKQAKAKQSPKRR
jgi:hypothetical protein